MYTEKRILDGIKAVKKNLVCGPGENSGIFDFIMSIIYLDKIEIDQKFRITLNQELEILKNIQGKDANDIRLAILDALMR